MSDRQSNSPSSSGLPGFSRSDLFSAQAPPGPQSPTDQVPEDDSSSDSLLPKPPWDSLGQDSEQSQSQSQPQSQPPPQLEQSPVFAAPLSDSGSVNPVGLGSAGSPPGLGGSWSLAAFFRSSRGKLALIFLAGLAILAGIILFLAPGGKKKPSSGGETAITYWGLFEPTEVFRQVIADYEQDHPGVKINYAMQDVKYYRERLQAALARGEGPDIFRFHQTWVPMLGENLSPLPTSVYSAAEFEQIFYPSAKETLKYRGNYVGVPLMFEGLALFYNEDLFRAAGVAPPQTWDQLREAAVKLTVRDSQGKIRTAGAALGTTTNVDHWSDILGLMMLQNGASLANPSSSLGVDALSFFALFTTVDRVWDETLPSSTYAFATEMLAMYFGPSWRIFEIKELNPDLNFKVIPVPQLPNGQIAWASFWAEGVSQSSAHQEEAWVFLDYLSSPETLERLYQAQAALRGFGEAYPRVDMADKLKTQPYVAPYIEQAPYAQSWYLASRTADGETGINSRIIKYFEDAVNAVNQGGDPATALQTTAQGVAQVLRQYNLTQ